MTGFEGCASKNKTAESSASEKENVVFGFHRHYDQVVGASLSTSEVRIS